MNKKKNGLALGIGAVIGLVVAAKVRDFIDKKEQTEVIDITEIEEIEDTSE